MIIEYKYYPEYPEELEAALKVKFEIEYIMFCIDFDVSKHYPATFDNPEEGGELEVESQQLLYVTTVQEPEIPVMINKEQKFIVGDYIDYKVLDQACWDAWHKQEEQDTESYMEFLYDSKHDR